VKSNHYGNAASLFLQSPQKKWEAVGEGRFWENLAINPFGVFIRPCYEISYALPEVFEIFF
jgi:hypothetical protein